ncbi:hypothetical protein GCM10020220_066490 [Nonomuraea rubra]|uniref:hypothetical protein n=1 Tax=Nonomuraea rubra TaxID=46180 RepID=UPI0031F07EE4
MSASEARSASLACSTPLNVAFASGTRWNELPARDDPAAFHAYGRAQRPGGGVVRDQRGGAACRVLQQHGQRLGVDHQVAGQHGHGARGRARDLGDAAQVGGQAAGGAHHLDLAHGQRGELVAEAVEQRAVTAVEPARGCRGEQQDRRGRALAGQ